MAHCAVAVDKCESTSARNNVAHRITLIYHVDMCDLVVLSRASRQCGSVDVLQLIVTLRSNVSQRDDENVDC